MTDYADRWDFHPKGSLVEDDECEGCGKSGLILGNEKLWYHTVEQIPVFCFWCKDCSVRLGYDK